MLSAWYDWGVEIKVRDQRELCSAVVICFVCSHQKAVFDAIEGIRGSGICLATAIDSLAPSVRPNVLAEFPLGSVF